MLRKLSTAWYLLVCAAAVAWGQGAPVIEKVDPPNWFAGMEHPLFLLVKGEALGQVRWSLSDKAIHITSQKSSSDGHWAMLWLSGLPAGAETVELRAEGAGGERAKAQYTFAARKPASLGFAGFSPADVLYLIMTDRFADGDPANDGVDAHTGARSAEAATERGKAHGWHGGDLRGIREHLDYLKDLGVTTLWITPVYANEGEPQSYHGYGATDMYKVDPHYGSLADLQELAAAAHAKGIKLALDTVPNHVGAKHPWANDPPEHDWLHGSVAEHGRAEGNFTPLVDPHGAWRDQQWVLDGWFANVLPDLNQGNPDTSQYLIQNAIWWIEEAGLDALRIDTFPFVDRPFWAQFHEQIRALYPHVNDVGEVFYRDPVVTSYFAGGAAHDGVGGVVDTGLWTPFDFPTYFTLRDVLLGGKPMSDLAKVWADDRLYPHPERLVPFLGNHDTARFLSAGEGATPAKLRLAFGILLTMRGTPQIYSGDELAMRGGDDPENRQDFPGGFAVDQSQAPGAAATAGDAMRASAFTSAGRSGERGVTWDWVHSLLAMRAAHPALLGGAQQSVFADDTALGYVRLDSNSAAGERILVVANKASYAREVRIATGGTTLSGCSTTTTLLGQAALTCTGQEAVVEMSADSLGVWTVK